MLRLHRLSEDQIGMLEWDTEHGSMGDYPGPHAVLKGYGLVFALLSFAGL